MKDDPRWMKNKFPNTCRRCGRTIAKGEEIYYYPRTKTVYCSADDCGGEEARQFDAVLFDEM